MAPWRNSEWVRRVVKNYEKLSSQAQREQVFRSLSLVTTLGLSPLREQLFLSDSRDFAVSLEAASRALIYAQSLARLGQTDRARKALDAMLAAPEICGIMAQTHQAPG